MAESAVEFARVLIAEGRRLAEEDERRLGRRLTADEAREIAEMVIRQILALGVSQVQLGSKGHRTTFKTSALEGEYDIEYQYFIKNPTTDVARYQLAESARVFMPNEDVLREIVQVENPTDVINRKRIEDAERLSPSIGLYRAARALIAAGRTVEAEIIADELGITLEQLNVGDVKPDMPTRPQPQPARNIAMPGPRAESNTRATEIMGQPRNGSRGV